MFGLPHITKCPCCAKSNFVVLNKAAQDHNFKSLENYVLRKKFKCKKCGEEIALFQSDSNQEKVLWLNLFMCEENYYTELTRLRQKRAKLNTTKAKSFININDLSELPLPCMTIFFLCKILIIVTGIIL